MLDNRKVLIQVKYPFAKARYNFLKQYSVNSYTMRLIKTDGGKKKIQFHTQRKWWVPFSHTRVLIIVYEIEQQFVTSANSTLLIINDLESSSLVSLSRLSGLVLQSINCTWRKRLAVQSRSCLVTPRCCLACSAARPVQSFPCCLLLHAAAVLVSSPGHPYGYPAPSSPSRRRHHCRSIFHLTVFGVSHLTAGIRQP